MPAGSCGERRFLPSVEMTGMGRESMNLFPAPFPVSFRAPARNLTMNACRQFRSGKISPFGRNDRDGEGVVDPAPHPPVSFRASARNPMMNACWQLRREKISPFGRNDSTSGRIDSERVRYDETRSTRQRTRYAKPHSNISSKAFCECRRFSASSQTTLLG